MPEIVPVSQERHAGKGWIRRGDYVFALNLETVPLVAAEMVRAAGSLPIIFLRKDEKFVPAAMMGIGTGRNVFLTQAGKWLGGYVPAALRTHPFRLGQAQKGSAMLCIDEASGLLADGDAPDCQSFFDSEGTPSPPLKEMLDLLVQVERSRLATEKAMAALKAAQLIIPWPIKVQQQHDEKTIKGLFKIDEVALKALSSEVLGPLHETGALELAYCHLIARQHVSLLSQLLQAHDQRETAMRARTPNLLDPDESPDIHIDWERLKSKQ